MQSTKTTLLYRSYYFLRTLLCEREVSTSFTHPTLLRNTTQQMIFSVCGSVNASNNYKKGGEGTTSDTFFFLVFFFSGCSEHYHKNRRKVVSWHCSLRYSLRTPCEMYLTPLLGKLTCSYALSPPGKFPPLFDIVCLFPFKTKPGAHTQKSFTPLPEAREKTPR